MRSRMGTRSLAGTLAVTLALTATMALGQTGRPQAGRVYKVGFSQIVDHPALNETRRGFVDGLEQFELPVNVRAAAAAGLTIPKEVLDRATGVHGR